MKISLLPYLACLSCGSDIELSKIAHAEKDSATGEIMEGTLSCTSCQRQVPISRGIPRFISAEESLAEDVQTGARFCESWERFSRLDDRYFRQFFDWLAPVAPEHLEGKVVLEGGCGKGRHSAIVSQVGAKEVISVDIGHSADVAFKNVGHLSNVHIVQADIMNLPLKPSIDFAFSVGVIHHMTWPDRGFKSLSQKVRPDGSIAVWVYGRENNWWVLWLVNPVRSITSRLPDKLTAALSWVLAIVVYILSKFAVSWSAKCKRNSRLPRFFYQDYLSYIGEFDFTEIYNIVFDHLIAPVAHYVSKEELQEWFSDAGMPNAKLRWHNQNSWTGFSYKNQHNVAPSAELRVPTLIGTGEK